MDDAPGVPHVYSLLESEIERLEAEIGSCSVLAEKAELIGELNQMRYAATLLKKCEEFGVHPSSPFTSLPHFPGNDGIEYRVMNDLSTDERRHWREVKRLYGGCVLVETCGFDLPDG